MVQEQNLERDQIVDIVIRVKRGESYRDISEKLGINLVTVRRAYRKHYNILNPMASFSEEYMSKLEDDVRKIAALNFEEILSVIDYARQTRKTAKTPDNINEIPVIVNRRNTAQR